MGFGSTAKKIQVLADRAEQLYEQLMELRERVIGLEESVDESTERLHALERRSTEQQALLEAIAREHGIDVEDVLANVAIEEAEEDAEGGDGATEGDAVEGTETAAESGSPEAQPADSGAAEAQSERPDQ